MDSDSESEDLLVEDPGVFDDYTVASSWERLISDIEATCRKWQISYNNNYLNVGSEIVDGHGTLRQVHANLTHGTKSYRLDFFFEADSSGSGSTRDDWKVESYQLQLWFGVRDFLTIAPMSLSGVILDAPEATYLLSAVAIALSNCGSTWPAFVPVHDPTRKAHKGIQGMKGPYCRSFESDRIGSQVPVKLMHLEGLYDLFVTKLAFSLPDSAHEYDGRIRFTMRLTYRTPMPGFESIEVEHVASPSVKPLEDYENEVVERVQWDEGYPWADWYSVDDPIKGFELTTTWGNRIVESSLDMAEYENVATLEADKWLLSPVISHSLEDFMQTEIVCFASRIRKLLVAFSYSTGAKFMDDFSTDDSPAIQKISSSLVVPPPGVLGRVLKDLFQNGLSWNNDGCHEKFQDIKGAATGSLFSQFCLHALWFGNCNIRAISILWLEFVREVRWCWEELQPLPRVSLNENVDFSTCLIHQKLVLLSECIRRKRAGQLMETNKATNGDHDINNNIVKDVLTQDESINGSLTDPIILLKSREKLCVPVMQDLPIMTEDMLLEHEHAMVALNDSPSGRMTQEKLQTKVLSADMAAFKAANPTAIFEDFIRWYSPKDWKEADVQEGIFENLEFPGSSANSYHRKGNVSDRMSQPGNMWITLWESIEALPASKQKSIFDHTREGEKVIHYLETLRPRELLGQMICTAFSSVADILYRTEVGKPRELKIEIDRLYATIISILKPLRKINVPDTEAAENMEGWNEDMMDLCTLLEKVEKHVIMAASFHEKLFGAPRLFSAFFRNYVDLEKQRRSLSEVALRQIVSTTERDVIARDLFPPVSLDEALKKTLRMGNFLNGHEPYTREIIFSHFDHYSEDQRERYKMEEFSKREHILSHRMYIHGTANDLQVAYSVVSND